MVGRCQMVDCVHGLYRLAAQVTVRLRRLQSIIDRGLPLSPVHDEFDVQLLLVEAGRCTAGMPAELVIGQQDPRSAGPLLVLADAVLGIALSSVLPETLGISTLRLGIRLLASRWPISGRVTATARADDIDDESGTSHGWVRDDDGRLLATFDTRCAVLRAPEEWLHRFPDAGVERGEEEHPAGELNLELVADQDQVTMRAQAGPELGNVRSAVQGGALAWYADRLLVPLLDRGDQQPRPLSHDLDVHFLRGVSFGGLTGSAQRVHPGRRLRTARAEILDTDQRVMITATGLSYAG